ncbi:FAR1-related sequence 5-like protein, partial [Tanacetum coccineum]
MIQVTLKEGLWVMDRFRAEHNHTFDIPSKVLKQRSHNIFHRSDECKDVVSLLTKAGMKPSKITKIFNAFRGNEDDKLSRVQCSNIVSNEREYNLGKECHGIIMHFQEKAETDQYFYFAMDLSKDGTLRSVFWADGRSRSFYCQFGDVVIFDTTYRTNKFSFPFAPFVGVNHHGFSEIKTSILCMAHPKTCYGTSSITTISLKSDNVQDFESQWEEVKEKYDIMDHSWLAKMHVEADQDLRTTNSKPTLHGDHPIEAMASECFTRNIYEVFKKEWKASGHEKLSKDSYFVKYRVGYLNGDKENWKIVECNAIPKQYILVTFNFKKISSTSRLLLDLWKVPKKCIDHDGSAG